MVFANYPKRTTVQLLLMLTTLVFYDTAIDLLLGVAHAIFELLHTLFELIEQALDLIVEHLFHTELHATQVIVFYILLSSGSFLVFKATKFFLGWYKKRLKDVINFGSETKEKMCFYSSNLVFLKKLRQFSTAMAVVSLLIAFCF